MDKRKRKDLLDEAIESLLIKTAVKEAIESTSNQIQQQQQKH